MTGEHASQAIEGTGGRGFHADVRGLCEALGSSCEPPPSSKRSEAATQPYANPFADTLAAGGSSFAGDRPDWCVDVGTALLTMTTFELWEAIERAQVLPWMRVWREGMECWTPIGEIAEFTWAIAGTPAPPAEPEAPPSIDPALDPAPPAADPDAIEAPPESTIRPAPAYRGTRWIALGSAVALAAIISAIVMGGGSSPAPPAETRVASHAPAAEAVATAAPVPVLSLQAAPAKAARHDDPGQHRLPRDGRRGYGR